MEESKEPKVMYALVSAPVDGGMTTATVRLCTLDDVPKLIKSVEDPLNLPQPSGSGISFSTGPLEWLCGGLAAQLDKIQDDCSRADYQKAHLLRQWLGLPKRQEVVETDWENEFECALASLSIALGLSARASAVGDLVDPVNFHQYWSEVNFAKDRLRKLFQQVKESRGS